MERRNSARLPASSIQQRQTDPAAPPIETDHSPVPTSRAEGYRIERVPASNCLQPGRHRLAGNMALLANIRGMVRKLTMAMRFHERIPPPEWRYPTPKLKRNMIATIKRMPAGPQAKRTPRIVAITVIMVTWITL